MTPIRPRHHWSVGLAARYADSVTHSSRRTLSRDTTPDAEAAQIEIYRRMSPGRKFLLVEEANRTVRAGLRQRHPNAGEAKLFRRQTEMPPIEGRSSR